MINIDFAVVSLLMYKIKDSIRKKNFDFIGNLVVNF